MELLRGGGGNPLDSVLTPEVTAALGEERRTEEAWLDAQGERAVASNSTILELRREMRRDHLELASMGSDLVNTDIEARLLARKYSAVLDSSREDLGEIASEWERAKVWAEERVGTDIWLGECDLGRTRRFLSESAHGLDTALRQLGVSVCYDLRGQSPRFVLPSGEWLEMTDRSEGGLRELIGDLYAFVRASRTNRRAPRAVPAVWSNARWRTSLDALLGRNEVDPFAEWLRKLPKWDGMRRLDAWLPATGFDFGDADTELVAWASRSIPMAAVGRALAPGAKHDTIPVLIGPQGSGKSTALAWLLPADKRLEWFNDNLRLSADEKSKVESLQGAVIVEVSEMTGATTADIESLKAFLSRSSDRVRLAYRKNPESSPRRCSIVGTANGAVVLPNDPTGNRRFVALGIRAGDPASVRGWLDAHREQLWAEALARAKEGEEAWFPEELVARQAAANERYRSGDAILEDAVADWIAGQREGFARDWTMKEIAEEVGMTRQGESATAMPVGQARRLGRVLNQFGCERAMSRRAGRMVRIWRLPERIETARGTPAPKPENGEPE